MNDTIDLMNQHRSIRRYEPTPVPGEHIDAALRAGQSAATSSAVQAYSVIRVEDPSKRAELAELAGPQEKVAASGAFFVFCADARRHRVLCERAGARYADLFENFLVAITDATLFAQNMTLAFESLGYGTCYIGGIRNDLPRVARVLSMPQGVFPLYGLCVGVAAESPGPRPRLGPDSVMFTDEYPSDETLVSGVDAYDSVYRDYLKQRGAEPKNWSDAMVGRFISAARASVGAFYRTHGAPMG